MITTEIHAFTEDVASGCSLGHVVVSVGPATYLTLSTDIVKFEPSLSFSIASFRLSALTSVVVVRKTVKSKIILPIWKFFTSRSSKFSSYFFSRISFQWVSDLLLRCLYLTELLFAYSLSLGSSILPLASNFLVPSIVVIVQMKETNFISNGWTYG